MIKKDHVAAGLCCIQLFMNSASQEEAIKHLENSKVRQIDESSLSSFTFKCLWNLAMLLRIKKCIAKCAFKLKMLFVPHMYLISKLYL